MPDFTVTLSSEEIAEVMARDPEYIAEVLECATYNVLPDHVVDYIIYGNLNDVREYIKGLLDVADSHIMAAAGYKPHIGRMLVEMDDLSEKIQKLEAFLKSDNKPSGITEEQINDLVEQLSYMKGYQKVLSRRIGASKNE